MVKSKEKLKANSYSDHFCFLKTLGQISPEFCLLMESKQVLKRKANNLSIYISYFSEFETPCVLLLNLRTLKACINRQMTTLWIECMSKNTIYMSMSLPLAFYVHLHVCHYIACVMHDACVMYASNPYVSPHLDVLVSKVVLSCSYMIFMMVSIIILSGLYSFCKIMVCLSVG